jgi:hypothetical protein
MSGRKARRRHQPKKGGARPRTGQTQEKATAHRQLSDRQIALAGLWVAFASLIVGVGQFATGVVALNNDTPPAVAEPSQQQDMNSENADPAPNDPDGPGIDVTPDGPNTDIEVHSNTPPA